MKLRDKVKDLLRENHLSMGHFEAETGIHRAFFTRYDYHKPRRTTIAAIAYYFGIGVEELVEGTDAEDIWYS